MLLHPATLIVYNFGLVLVWISLADCKICLKNEAIGYREGNLYSCDDPSKSSCCEKNREFTCCVPSPESNLIEQLQLWGTITCMISVMVFVYIYYAKDREVFRRETLQLAMDNFISKFSKRRPKNFSTLNEEQDTDTTAVVPPKK